MIKLIPVSGALGAEVVDFDLRGGDDAAFDELRAALHEHEVLFVRGAHLDATEHIALGRKLGEPSIFPTARLRGVNEPSCQVITDGPDSPGEADSWHTDVTWTAVPPKYALLCAEVVPERGGDTLWASMTTAYDALSPVMQQLLCGLAVVHDNESFIGGLMRKAGDAPGAAELVEKLRANYPPVTHPLVRTHPDTGRQALFLGGRFMRRIVGMTEVESQTVLDFLSRHIADPRFHCRWRWTPGDLAIWDERSTNHRSAGDYFPQVRSVRRIEIDGDPPFFRPADVSPGR